MAEPSDASVVEEDLSCFRCGYNLRSLQPEGVCPECGEAVKVSLPGRTLAVADARWLRRQWQGAMVQAIGLIVIEAAFLALVLGGFRSRSALFCMYLAFGGTFAASGIAVGRMCLAEPGGPYWDDAPWLRRLIGLVSSTAALGVVVYAAMEVGEILWHYQPRDMVFWQNVLGTIGFGGGLVGDSLLMWYLSRLAKRLPSRRMVIHGRWAAWSSPVAMGVTIGLVAVANWAGIVPREWMDYCIGIPLYSALFLWPAGYCLAWARCIRPKQESWPGGLAARLREL